MSGHLQPIKLDSYKPLRELVCENIRQAIIDAPSAPANASWKSSWLTKWA